jgi:hypothetical protein
LINKLKNITSTRLILVVLFCSVCLPAIIQSIQWSEDRYMLSYSTKNVIIPAGLNLNLDSFLINHSKTGKILVFNTLLKVERRKTICCRR